MFGGKVIFAFDFDGTVTTTETLPLLGKATNHVAALAHLTEKTLAGELSFAESFAARVRMLEDVPLDLVRKTISEVPLNERIVNFIRRHYKECVIVTGNLDLWLEPLTAKLHCPIYSSHGFVDEYGCVRLKSIIDKGEVAAKLRSKARLVAVGDGAGDIDFFTAADFAVAYAGVHNPPPALAAVADAVAANSEELCRILEKMI